MRYLLTGLLLLMSWVVLAQDTQDAPAEEEAAQTEGLQLPEGTLLPEDIDELLDCIPPELAEMAQSALEEQAAGEDTFAGVAGNIPLDEEGNPVICPDPEETGDGTERGDDAESRVEPVDEAAQDESSADEDSGESEPDEEDFTPTEEISEDYPVPLPSDI